MSRRLIKLKPAYKDYLWGGRRLIDEYGKDFTGDILAESWELSCHPDGPSIIANGADEGLSLAEYITREGWDILGTNCDKFSDFPILIKLIDAKQKLSIQVHPDDDYAKVNEGQNGKTEVWYVVDCEADAYLYYGVKEDISQEELARRIADDTITEILHKAPVKAGDVFFIEAGTIHAIGKDIVIAEVQQNSNVTYRVHDFGRVGVDGQARELHIDKAVEVSTLVPSKEQELTGDHIAQCEYFTVDKLKVKDEMTKTVPDNSFLSILVLDGNGVINIGEEQEEFQKGDSFFLPAGEYNYGIKGEGEFLLSYL
jgi:mannose-6-phosphate isomerase, class I